MEPRLVSSHLVHSTSFAVLRPDSLRRHLNERLPRPFVHSTPLPSTTSDVRPCCIRSNVFQMCLFWFVRRECASTVDAQAQEDRTYVSSKEEEVLTRARAGDVQLLASKTRKDARSRGVAFATWHPSFEKRCDDDVTTTAANGRFWMDFTCASMRRCVAWKPSFVHLHIAKRFGQERSACILSLLARIARCEALRTRTTHFALVRNSCDVLRRNDSDKETKAHEEEMTRGRRKKNVVREEGDVHVSTMSAMGSRRRTRNDLCIALSVQRNASSTETKPGFVRGPRTRLLDAT